MKSAILYSVFASVSLIGLNGFAQGTCHSGGGNQPYPGQGSPYGQPSPYGQNGSFGQATNVPFFPTSAPNSSINPTSSTANLTSIPFAATQTAPQARITVLSSAPAAPSARLTVVAEAPTPDRGGTLDASRPSARLTVVAEPPHDELKTEVAKAVKASEEVAQAAKTSEEVANAVKTSEEESAKLDAALEGLVGTWTAVARRGDGELTTVELQLDDRGWVKLTVPGTDGKPTTIKRRAEINNKEIKLTGGETDVLLGKLVDVNSRQLVLERDGGQVTFVRP